MESRSEVARISQQIALEYEACQRVLTGFTPTARHEFITKRQENIEACFQELKQHVTSQEAMAILTEVSNAVTSTPSV